MKLLGDDKLFMKAAASLSEQSVTTITIYHMDRSVIVSVAWLQIVAKPSANPIIIVRLKTGVYLFAAIRDFRPSVTTTVVLPPTTILLTYVVLA